MERPSSEDGASTGLAPVDRHLRPALPPPLARQVRRPSAR
jgi:hypothetical protein